jgi:hypothetical protein
LASEWNYDKNTIKPDEITPKSAKKVWWKCKSCGFEWMDSPTARTSGNRCHNLDCSTRKIKRRKKLWKK